MLFKIQYVVGESSNHGALDDMSEGAWMIEELRKSAKHVPHSVTWLKTSTDCKFLEQIQDHKHQHQIHDFQMQLHLTRVPFTK